MPTARRLHAAMILAAAAVAASAGTAQAEPETYAAASAAMQAARMASAYWRASGGRWIDPTPRVLFDLADNDNRVCPRRDSDEVWTCGRSALAFYAPELGKRVTASGPSSIHAIAGYVSGAMQTMSPSPHRQQCMAGTYLKWYQERNRVNDWDIRRAILSTFGQSRGFADAGLAHGDWRRCLTVG